MKKIYFTMFVALLSIATSQAKKDPELFTAQDYAKYNIDEFDGVADGKADFMAAAQNIMANFSLDRNGFVGQTTTIDCPGMSKQEIYVQAKLWLEKFCAKDKKAELRLDANEGTTLIARKRLKDVNHGAFVKGLKLKKNYNLRHNHGKLLDKSDLWVNLLVNIQIDVKEEKCRLITTIEDYGIYEPANNTIVTSPIGLVGAAIGTAVYTAIATDKAMIPANNYPFRETYQNDETLSKRKNNKEAKKFERRKPTAAVAYVASFLITQIVHDKVVEFVTSSASYGKDSNW